MTLATLCYIQQNNQTLMLHRVKKDRDSHQGKFVALGGKLEPGESPEECIIREVKEECGLKITNPQFKGFLTFHNPGKDNNWYVFVFIANQFTGELHKSNEGRLEWVDSSKLLDLDMWEGDRLFTPWLLKPGIFSGKLIYQDDKLVDHQVVFY